MCPAFAHTYISYFYVDRSLKTDYYCKLCLLGYESETEFPKKKNRRNKKYTSKYKWKIPIELESN